MDEIFDIEEWPNIEYDTGDPEIQKIDQLGLMLEPKPENVTKIRSLIKHFEVCHFKYKHHIDIINTSIDLLVPQVDPETIGIKHPRKNDTDTDSVTNKRNKTGRMYINLLRLWLDNEELEDTDPHAISMFNDIQKWLGERAPEKIRNVQMLIVRLTWDWESLEEINKVHMNRELEDQIMKVDICHYAFQGNLKSLIKAIGKNQPADDFEGCASCSEKRRPYFEKEFRFLLKKCKKLEQSLQSGGNSLMKAWLRLSFAKVIKEQINLSEEMAILDTIPDPD